MNGFRFSAAIVATLATVALTAAAQGTIGSDPKKTPKAEATKDQATMDAPKAPAKKAEPKKAEVKKPPAKAAEKALDAKATPKKAAPKKKVDPKVQPTAAGGTVQKYEAGKAPDLKDAKGNTVSSSPDAYDISSASAPAKKKK
jgi:hypothetical protein